MWAEAYQKIMSIEGKLTPKQRVQIASRSQLVSFIRYRRRGFYGSVAYRTVVFAGTLKDGWLDTDIDRAMIYRERKPKGRYIQKPRGQTWTGMSFE